MEVNGQRAVTREVGQMVLRAARRDERADKEGGREIEIQTEKDMMRSEEEDRNRKRRE